MCGRYRLSSRNSSSRLNIRHNSAISSSRPDFSTIFGCGDRESCNPNILLNSLTSAGFGFTSSCQRRNSRWNAARTLWGYFKGPSTWQYKAVALKDFTDSKVKEEISGGNKDYVRSLLQEG